MDTKRLIPFLLLAPSLVTVEQSADEEEEEYFKRWLDQDVRSIINLEKKAVFRRLGTTEEKEGFIEQFCARRDMDPQTSASEFKEEIYRRIAYANERFKSGRDGWQEERP